MQFNSLIKKALLFAFLVVGGTFGAGLVSPEKAEATHCFDSPAERIGSLPIDTYFPRASLVKDSVSCGYLGATETWSLVSSFYYTSPSSQSSLQTGRSRFTLFATGATAPAATQTVRVRYDPTGRCYYGGWPASSITEAWVEDLHPGAGNYGAANFGRIDTATPSDYMDITFNAQWVNGGVKYGTNVWKSQMSVVIKASDFGNSTISCKVRVASLSGTTITFTEQADQNPFAEAL